MGAVYHCGEQDALVYIGCQLDKAGCVSEEITAVPTKGWKLKVLFLNLQGNSVDYNTKIPFPPPTPLLTVKTPHQVHSWSSMCPQTSPIWVEKRGGAVEE